MELIKPDITPQELLMALRRKMINGVALLLRLEEGSSWYEELSESLQLPIISFMELQTALDGSDEAYKTEVFERIKEDLALELETRLAELELSQKFLQGKLNCIGRA